MNFKEASNPWSEGLPHNRKIFPSKSEIFLYTNDACCALWPHMDVQCTRHTRGSTLRLEVRETEPQTLGSSQQDDQVRPPNDVKSSNLIEDFTFFVVLRSIVKPRKSRKMVQGVLCKSFSSSTLCAIKIDTYFNPVFNTACFSFLSFYFNEIFLQFWGLTQSISSALFLDVLLKETKKLCVKCCTFTLPEM